MRVRIITEIHLEDDSGKTLISDFVEEHVHFDDKWSVRTALTAVNARAKHLFDEMRKLV